MLFLKKLFGKIFLKSHLTSKVYSYVLSFGIELYKQTKNIVQEWKIFIEEEAAVAAL